jgi:hypothetical protein
MFKRLLGLALLLSLAFPGPAARADDNDLTIFFFQATQGPNNLWTFSGQVSDEESPAGLTVALWGVYTYTGTATVQSDGTFSTTFVIPPQYWGTMNAQVKDGHEGENSNIATALVN